MGRQVEDTLGKVTIPATSKVLGYTGPLNKTQAPYVPGLSNNPSIKGTTTEIYAKQNSNGTPNTAFLPVPSSNNPSVKPTQPGNDVTSVAPVVAPVTNAELIVGSSSSSRSSRSTPRRPKLRSGQSMADLLGIRYDQDYIAELMSDAVAKQYANLDAEYGRTQDLYYDAVAGNADMLLQTLRRGDRDAVMSGLGSGTQAATELSGVLGVSKDNAQGATELAQGRSDLVFDREAALAKVKVDALKYYNDLGLNLGALSNSELNALVTAYASEVATEGGIYNTDVLAAVERERIASGERIAADQNATNLSISKNKKYSYSGGSGSSSGSSSDFEKATILAGLYSMTEDAQTKADLLKQIAAIYGITLSEAKEIADNKGNNKNPIIPGNMKTGNIDSYLESIMGKNYILR